MWSLTFANFASDVRIIWGQLPFRGMGDDVITEDSLSSRNDGNKGNQVNHRSKDKCRLQSYWDKTETSILYPYIKWSL
jgi:hypothetical protein